MCVVVCFSLLPLECRIVKTKCFHIGTCLVFCRLSNSFLLSVFRFCPMVVWPFEGVAASCLLLEPPYLQTAQLPPCWLWTCSGSFGCRGFDDDETITKVCSSHCFWTVIYSIITFSVRSASFSGHILEKNHCMSTTFFINMDSAALSVQVCVLWHCQMILLQTLETLLFFRLCSFSFRRMCPIQDI